MNVLNPWALGIGAAAIALPIAVHFLTRPRPRRMSLPTVRFIRSAVEQRRARHRLRDWLLLALRSLAVILLACAFARPLLGRQPLISARDGANATRVVIVDVSQSMSAAVNGVTPIASARDVAASYLNYRSDLEADLILAGATPRLAMPHTSTNFPAMREQLASANVESERIDVTAAINEGSRLLANSPASRRRELVIVSDFPAHQLGGDRLRAVASGYEDSIRIRRRHGCARQPRHHKGHTRGENRTRSINSIRR